MTNSNGSALPGDIGRGGLGAFALAAYRTAAISIGFVLACVPTAIVAFLLPPGGFSLLVVVPTVGLVAVALAAAMAAWRAEKTAEYPQPWLAFWRGYRRNIWDVLRALAPGLALLAVVLTTVSAGGAAGVQGVLLLVLAAAIAVLGCRVTVLASMFRFRVRDYWRLAIFTLGRVPRATVALLAVLVCVGGLAWVTNEAVVLLLGGLLARVVGHYERPVVELVRAEFTSAGEGA